MKKTLLLYFGFITTCLVVIVAFLTATTYLQLIVAILLYPLFVYFAYKVLPSKIYWEHSPKKTATISLEGGHTGIPDVKRRTFLKLIGGAGLLLLLLPILNKKSENIFLKTIPAAKLLEGTDNNQTNPTQDLPREGYSISEIDNDVIAYYGFIHKNGAWYIMKADTNTGSFRYTKGDSDFSGNWTNRKNLKYDLYSNVF